MAPKNVDTLRAAHESWNRRDFDATVSAMPENVSYADNARGLILRTREESGEWVKAWAQAFPDGKITNPRYSDAGDIVVVEFAAEGTNGGPYGTYPATGRRMALSFAKSGSLMRAGR